MGPTGQASWVTTELVVVAASTGGPRAVEELLGALPSALDAAVLVSIHMPAAFTGPYAQRLDRRIRLQAAEAADGERLDPGTVRVIPGGKQATLFRLGDALHLRLRPPMPEERYAPSADVVMASAAAVVGAGVVGVILTGMAGDGASGLAAIRSAGGLTVAQSRESALVFGMPGDAVRRGAARLTLGLEEMKAALIACCGLREAGRTGD